MGMFNARQMVVDAIRELSDLEQVITREVVAKRTGLPLSIVDVHFSKLADEGEIYRPTRGVVVLAERYAPARPISKTILPNGLVKIEIGDEVLTLTPREARHLGSLSMGAAMQDTTIESGHQATQLAGDINARLSRVERALRKDSKE